MIRILIVYGTVEGQSEKIAERIAADVRRAGLDPVALDASEIGPSETPPCDAVIVVASVHRGRHASSVEAFARAHHDWLRSKPSAFLSVSLSAASDRESSQHDAQVMLESFLEEVDWKPDLAMPVAGALAYSQYGFVKRRIMRAKAKGEGGDTDTSRDYEFTDWDRLTQEVSAFLENLPRSAPRLTRIAEEIWIAEGPPVPFMTIPYPTRMTLIRLSEGRLWVHSPILLDPELEKEVAALGRVEIIVSPNKIHHLFIDAWARAWPGSRLFAPPGLARRRRDLHFEAELGDVAPPEWIDEIDQVVVRGSFAMEEVFFFHRRSRTLIVGDLVQRFEPERLSRGQRALMRLDGMVGPKGSTPREWRASFWNRKSARAAIAKALAWDPERVVIAHGEWIEKDGRETLARCLRWLRPTTGARGSSGVGRDDARFRRECESFERNAELVRGFVVARYGEDGAFTLLREARDRYHDNFPQIRWVEGPRAPIMNSFLRITAQEIAVYQAVAAQGGSASEAWEICHEAIRSGMEHFPRWKRWLSRTLMFSSLMRSVVRRRAKKGEFVRAGDFEIRYVCGEGQAFDYGVDYLNCGNLELAKKLGAEEFAPYVCMSDVALSDALGWGLQRTQTLADGCSHCDFRFKKGGTTRISSKTPEVQQTIERIERSNSEKERVATVES